jgi:hypothetical protein
MVETGGAEQQDGKHSQDEHRCGGDGSSGSTPAHDASMVVPDVS